MPERCKIDLFTFQRSSSIAVIQNNMIRRTGAGLWRCDRERWLDWNHLTEHKQKDFAREYASLNRVGEAVGGVNA